jgi:phosphatidylglycerophosphatase A
VEHVPIIQEDNDYMSAMLNKLSVFLGTGLSVGYIKWAPGTWGSVLGLALTYLVQCFFVDKISLGVIGLLFIVIGLVITHFAEKSLGVHDDPRIVIDEVVGQYLSTCLLPQEWLPYLISFGLFRLFDIWKPGPIGYIDEHWPGAAGTFFDDILAGILVCALCFKFF